MKNIGYLVAAYGVFWVGLLLYAGSLVRRGRAVERSLARLRGRRASP